MRCLSVGRVSVGLLFLTLLPGVRAAAQPASGAPLSVDELGLSEEDERSARDTSPSDQERVLEPATGEAHPTTAGAVPAAESKPTRDGSDGSGTPTSCRVRTEVAQTCGFLACVQFDPRTARRKQTTIAHKGNPGLCGACETDVECGGRACRNGYCSVWEDAAPPEPFYPDFYLLTLEATANATGDDEFTLLPGLGFVYQGAFRKVAPAKMGDHGWVISDVPDYYFNLGGSLTLSFGGTQQALAELGVTRRVSWLALSTLGLSGLYQRRGSELWDFDPGALNVERVGGALSVGFLYNAFLRVAYLARVRGAEDAGGSLVVSVIYMRDLVGELLPDRFKSIIPEKFR